MEENNFKSLLVSQIANLIVLFPFSFFPILLNLQINFAPSKTEKITTNIYRNPDWRNLYSSKQRFKKIKKIKQEKKLPMLER